MADTRFQKNGNYRSPCVCCGDYGSFNKTLGITLCLMCREIAEDSPDPIKAVQGMMITAQFTPTLAIVGR